ncbi:membrane protein [Chelatococcus reniformis]|uniref:Membrane protein n=2 Tax=Chelatococcus reniformis TaxID=1494448 RepID=A0A916TXR1_9HYPH|nr:membrane protein [Chelatococcus reniformis]
MKQSSSAVWAGRALSAVVVILLAADVIVQFNPPESLRAEITATGFSLDQAPIVASILAVCTLLYAIPRTAALGAILITGFLGGAICTHLRIGEFTSPPQLISLALGVMAWGGLYLRNANLQRLIPISA